ncbi:MAG: hypothetical protein KDK38_10260 [Leptospiraceae bacterium]|nr:hypothetical protein [Leptospiraceae bacterium]
MQRNLYLFKTIFLIVLALQCTPSSKKGVEQISAQSLQINETETPAGINDVVTFLSGRNSETGNEIKPFLESAAYQRYKKTVRSTWANFEKRHISAMADFKASEKLATPKTLFYPFSGPDVTHPLTLFKETENFIMFGLEPVGEIPDPVKGKVANEVAKLPVLYNAVADVLHRNFFKTNDMRVDIKNKGYAGITGILLFFLGNLDATVTSVKYVDFGADGKFSDSTNRRCVQVQFKVPEINHTKFIRYCSLDLSDAGIAATPGAKEMLLNIDFQVTMLKAASYLTYRPSFDTIRTLILQKSDAILTDSSGMPYRFIKDTTQWNTTLYGNYIRPVPLFRERYQRDMATAYKNLKEKKPMNFYYGYHLAKGQAHLLYSVKEKTFTPIEIIFDGSNSKGENTAGSEYK